MSNVVGVEKLLTYILLNNKDKAKRIRSLECLRSQVRKMTIDNPGIGATSYRERTNHKKTFRNAKFCLLKDWGILIDLYLELGGRWKYLADIRGLLIEYIRSSIESIMHKATDVWGGYDKKKMNLFLEAIQKVVANQRRKLAKKRDKNGRYERFMTEHSDIGARFETRQ